MRRDSTWLPVLATGPGRLHERLCEGIAAAILSGTLPPGAPLPAHRTVAQALGVSVGTVTRAYEALQRRGLAASERGRGTFVARRAWPAPARADLSANLPPPMPTTAALARVTERIAGTVEAELFTRYAPPAGLPEHRAALARAVGEGRRLEIDPALLMITSGAQHGLFVALAAAPPGPLAIEALSYPGALRAARSLGRTLVPLEMDAEGIRPDALRAALASAEPPSTLYATPSLQNPTGATMGADRRAEIADMARAAGLTLIEDDVYAVFAPPDLPTLAELAPERTFHVGSLSKSFAPGLRVGHVAAPPDQVEACAAWLQATQSMANPLSALIMAQALADGLTASISRAVRAEAVRRSTLARGVLGDRLAPQAHEGLHVWAPMETARARDAVLAAARLDITLAPPAAFLADPERTVSGLRLCLGTLPETELRRVLETLAPLLDAGTGPTLALEPIV